MRAGTLSALVSIVFALLLAAAATGERRGVLGAPSWSGHWAIVDHGTGGAAAGNDYPWSVTFDQHGGTLTSVGTPSPYAAHGSAGGLSAHFTATGAGSYAAQFNVTMSANGSTFKGSWTDNEGNSGTATARHSAAAKTSIEGRVVETTCTGSGCKGTGLAGVRIVASGPAASAVTTTKSDGTYTLAVKTKGTWKVTPSLGSREFDPVSDTVVVPANGKALASFTTCAEERATQSVAVSACKQIELGVTRLLATDKHSYKEVDGGWATSSGKKYLNYGAVNVGFGIPEQNGQFGWLCESGCIDIRLKVRNHTTKEPIKGARVKVQAILLSPTGNVVSTASKAGVLCTANPKLSDGCQGDVLEAAVPEDGNLDLYYWAPGVIAPTNVLLRITTTAPKLKDVTATRTIAVKPSVAFPLKTIQLNATGRNLINTFGAVHFGLSGLKLSDYCARIEQFISSSDFNIDAAPAAFKLMFDATVSAAKTVTKICSLGEAFWNSAVTHAQTISEWVLYWYFAGAQFKVPPTGLHGQPTPISFLVRLALADAQFAQEFTAALHSYYYNGPFTTNVENYGVKSGDTMTLKLYEISTRGGDGALADGLYMVVGGSKHYAGKNNAIDPYTTTIDKNYLPGCWLDPRLRLESWKLAQDCTTPEEDAHS